MTRHRITFVQNYFLLVWITLCDALSSSDSSKIINSVGGMLDTCESSEITVSLVVKLPDWYQELHS